MNDTEWKLIDRFKEPSSWSAFAAGLGMIGVSVPPGLIQGIALIGAGICVVLGVALHEGARKASLVLAIAATALSLVACHGGAQQTGVDLAQDAGAGIVRNLSAADLQKLKDTCFAAAPAVVAAASASAPAALRDTAVYPYAFCQQLLSGSAGNADQGQLQWLPQVLAMTQDAAEFAGLILPIALKAIPLVAAIL